MTVLKAYTVMETESGEWSGAILFAESNIEARKHGAAEFNDGDLGAMSVHRAKWADKYGRRSAVPVRDLLDSGWHFECWGCGANIDTDWLYDHRIPLDDVIGFQEGPVYCCARCRRKSLNRSRRRKEQETLAIESLKQIVRLRFPQVEFADHESRYRTHHAYVDAGPAGWQWRQIAVSFNFPGMKIAPATLRFDANRFSRSAGPYAPEYSVCAGDREAFEAWTSSTRRAA